MQHQIVKNIHLNAPISRVWQALTDADQFGKWFCVNINGPFIVGEVSLGTFTSAGCEGVQWRVIVQKMEHEKLFSYHWHPYAVDSAKNYDEELTLVEFHLEVSAGGTLLTVVESGFEKIPTDRRSEAFRMNSVGWEEQLRNIAAYLS